MRNGIFLSIFAVEIFFILGFGSCTPKDLSAVCEEEVPKFERELNSKVLAFKELNPDAYARSIAGEAAATKPDKATAYFLEEEERESWEDWARESLIMVERFMDSANRYPKLFPIRNEMKSLADEFVNFHGYASAGNFERMRRSLASLEMRETVLREKLCLAVEKGELGPMR